MRGVSEDKIDSRARTISTVVRDARRVDLMFEVLRAVVRYAPRLLALRLRHELLEASGTSTWLEYMRESEYALPKLKANKAEKGRQRALTRGLTPSKGVNFSGRLDDTAEGDTPPVEEGGGAPPPAEPRDSLPADQQDTLSPMPLPAAPLATPLAAPAAAPPQTAAPPTTSPPVRTSKFAAGFAKRAAKDAAAVAATDAANAPPAVTPPAATDTPPAATDAPPASSPPPSPPYPRPPSPPMSPPEEDKPKRGVLGGAAHKAFKVVTGKKKPSASDLNAGEDVDVASLSSSSAGSSAKVGLSGKLGGSGKLGSGKMGSTGQLVSGELGGESLSESSGASAQPAGSPIRQGSKRGSFLPAKLAPPTSVIAKSTAAIAATGVAAGAGAESKVAEGSSGSGAPTPPPPAPSSGGAAAKKRSMLAGGMSSALGGMASSMRGKQGAADSGGGGGGSKMSDDERHERIGAAIGKRAFARALVLIDEGLAANPTDAILKSYRGWVKDLVRSDDGGGGSEGSGEGGAGHSPVSTAVASASEEVYKWRDGTDVRGRATLSQLRAMIEADEVLIQTHHRTSTAGGASCP